MKFWGLMMTVLRIILYKFIPARTNTSIWVSILEHAHMFRIYLYEKKIYKKIIIFNDTKFKSDS